MREELKNTKKLGNKGFSLIELIIVIAIMAILVGIVGTQVVPFLEKSKQAKDEQIVSAILTSATTAFASNAAVCDYPATGTQTITFKTVAAGATGGIVLSTTNSTGLSDVSTTLQDLTNYHSLNDVTGAMTSKASKEIDTIEISRDNAGVVSVECKMTATTKYAGVFKKIQST